MEQEKRRRKERREKKKRTEKTQEKRRWGSFCYLSSVTTGKEFLTGRQFFLLFDNTNYTEIYFSKCPQGPQRMRNDPSLIFLRIEGKGCLRVGRAKG